MSKVSQCRKILAHLRVAPITTLQAIYWLGCTRLSARIYDLKEAGNRIDGTRKKVKNRRGESCWVMEYRLKKEATNIITRRAA
jgi:Helix-turn-helix domain